MNDTEKNVICAVCVIVGIVAPWGLLVAAAVVALVTSSAYWGETAAYMGAMGLILMSGSYILGRLKDVVDHRR